MSNVYEKKRITKKKTKNERKNLKMLLYTERFYECPVRYKEL